MAESAPNRPRAAAYSTAEKPPLPYMGSGRSETNPLDNVLSWGSTQKRLNLEDWDVDPTRIYRQLTGKDLQIDEHSRLVS